MKKFLPNQAEKVLITAKRKISHPSQVKKNSYLARWKINSSTYQCWNRILGTSTVPKRKMLSPQSGKKANFLRQGQMKNYLFDSNGVRTRDLYIKKAKMLPNQLEKSLIYS